MRFRVKLDEVIIGFTELEHGDPSMGCASGLFVPTPAYSSIQQYCIDHLLDWKPIRLLTISLLDGDPIENVGGIQITDFGPGLEHQEIEISICGVVKPPYEELFPQHMEAHYKNRMK